MTTLHRTLCSLNLLLFPLLLYLEATLFGGWKRTIGWGWDITWILPVLFILLLMLASFILFWSPYIFFKYKRLRPADTSLFDKVLLWLGLINAVLFLPLFYYVICFALEVIKTF